MVNKGTSPSAPAEGEKVVLFYDAVMQGAGKLRHARVGGSFSRRDGKRMEVLAHPPKRRVSCHLPHIFVPNAESLDARTTENLPHDLHQFTPREDRGGPGPNDGPIGAGGPDVPGGGDAAPSSGERPKLKLAPRSKPAGQAAAAAAPAPASAKKSSIFGGGKAHDEFAYEVRQVETWSFALSLNFGHVFERDLFMSERALICSCTRVGRASLVCQEREAGACHAVPLR